MSGVGNDNYRAGLEPPQPIKRGGWLSSNMAQLMVFLNGLILTVTAYATLSVFIQEIVSESVMKTADEGQQRIVSMIGETEQVVATSGLYLTLAEKEQGNNALKALRTSMPNMDMFDQMYWVHDAGEGNWKIVPLSARKMDPTVYPPFIVNPNTEFLKYILGKQEKALPQILVTDLPDTKPHGLLGAEDVVARPMAIVRTLEGTQRSVIVGFFHLGAPLDSQWLQKRDVFSSVEITDKESGALLAGMERLPEGGKGEDHIYHNVFTASIAGLPIELKIGLQLDQREAFLKKIPFLMLLFGVTLTLIGTLYVRNNQKQSLRLASMNKELAQKNFELNTQINEREKLNNALRKAERENRAVIDSVSDIIFETTVDGELLFLNDTWKKVTGFTVDRSVGRNLFEMLYPQDQQEQRENFKELVKGHKQAYRAFTRLRTSDGTFRAVELAVSMIRQDENKDLRVVGTFTDVEERRRAERALSEAEKKYRTIVENAAGGIYQITPDGLFLSANPSMARILGYDAPEEILRDIRNANTQVYVDATERNRFLKELQNEGASSHSETQVRRKDGSIIWVNENVRSVYDEESNLLYYEGSMEDITQRKVAEIALRDAKVDSDLSSRAKSEFLANMSHELRTPLNAIIGFSEIIKNEVFGPVGSKEYYEYANDIFESGKKLLNVINEILDVSRIEAGERQLNEGVVDLQKTVKTCLDLLAPKIHEGKLIINNLMGPESPRLIGEQHAIKQMIMNLLSNSVKYTPDGGRITLGAEIDSAGSLRILVTDTGIGLSEDEIQKALSPFGQVNAAFSRYESGAGLGLTLVKSLVGLHGGSLELFSQKGVGTTATLVFPPKRVAKNNGPRHGQDNHVSAPDRAAAPKVEHARPDEDVTQS